MRYKIFGRRTGLRVSELALGTGNFGTRWGHGAEREEAKKVFDYYAEAGGNFIDTADNRLDVASAIPLGMPHEQISGSAAAIAGGKRELLDLPAIPVA